MTLVERMVLLCLDSVPGRRLHAANLQSVLSRLNTRYQLDMEQSLQSFGALLAGMSPTCIECTPTGVVLNDGGFAEVREIRRKQSAFCSKVSLLVEKLVVIPPIERSTSYAHVRIPVLSAGLSARL